MIGDKDLAIPAKMMDLYSAQQKITAHNIANACVKDFHKLHVSFGDELRQAIEAGDAESVRSAALHVEKARQPGVDTEMEAASGAKNELQFNAFAEIAAYRLRMLRAAVNSKKRRLDVRPKEMRMPDNGSISALDISASGLSAQKLRMNVIAGNIANANSLVTPDGGPYRRREVTFATVLKSAAGAAPGENVACVSVASVTVSKEPLKTVYDPDHPMANKKGFVQVPNVDVTKEMVDMVSAQREYEANLAAMKAYREMMRNSISILRQ